ncbi:hypothetical protein OHA37_26945 [Streptomyces sp. NBC_00335]|uniref:hypothetical protein n=1 Tax=unclassified Streptomyces TaxID=2593676 RepID=UPI00224CFC10|nr:MULTISPECIES: hypothetical protein [unclassified Streptomyces]MCX5407488.1 hypothetical protein [Streptomyces sp. NBC_00086]
MEVLIAACLLAWAAGAQSEQAKLGLSPAERDLRREHVRHERAVRKIADKHGSTPADSGVEPLTIPESFRSGYRGHTPLERVATPAGRHLGNWTAKGVYWARDTGRSALKEYRERRKAEGEPDPAPIIEPPFMPPMPTEPPTAGVPSGVVMAKPEAPAAPAAEGPAPAPLVEAPATAATPPAAAPAPAGAALVPGPREPEAPTAPTEASEPIAPAQPHENGVGRMAAEITYESVLDESGELSAMCEDDLLAYDRIRDRCEREIGRADELVAQLRSPGMRDWISRCAEQYRVILAQLDDLKSNTIAQSEAVTKAKASLESGQGFYASIAADMETVEDREFYTSDRVDSEDVNAESEIYETQGA